MLTSAYN